MVKVQNDCKSNLIEDPLEVGRRSEILHNTLLVRDEFILEPELHLRKKSIATLVRKRMLSSLCKLERKPKDQFKSHCRIQWANYI